jgi:A/G-specific adenine glycosylase
VLSSEDKCSLHEIPRRLTAWFEKYGREFPWRDDSYDAYRLLVTEILLQRTRAETVNSFVDNFFQAYPSWEFLAEATEVQIAEALRGIGLQSRRAATLSMLSKHVVANNCEMPNKRSDIEALPGVGQYIANAVELLVHGRSRPLLDTNMSRVIERYLRPRQLADIRHDPWLQAAAQYFVEQGDAKIINWAVLDLGALVCKPGKPSCGVCPLQDECSFAKTDSMDRTSGPGVS